MSKRIFLGLVVAAVLLLNLQANAMVGLGEGYNIGAIGAANVNGRGIATEGTVVNVDNTQTATEIGRCGSIQVGMQTQKGMLVQGGTAIGTRPGSNACVMQGAGAEGGQILLVTRDSIVGGQEQGLCMGQATNAENGAAADAGQGAILGQAQFGGNKDGVAGNASLIGAVNISSAIAGPRSEAMSGSAVTTETGQTTIVQ